MPAGLLASLRLPERVVNALAEAARDVGLIRFEVTRVREQTEPLDEVLRRWRVSSAVSRRGLTRLVRSSGRWRAKTPASTSQ